MTTFLFRVEEDSLYISGTVELIDTNGKQVEDFKRMEEVRGVRARELKGYRKKITKINVSSMLLMKKTVIGRLFERIRAKKR